MLPLLHGKRSLWIKPNERSLWTKLVSKLKMRRKKEKQRDWKVNWRLNVCERYNKRCILISLVKLIFLAKTQTCHEIRVLIVPGSEPCILIT